MSDFEKALAILLGTESYNNTNQNHKQNDVVTQDSLYTEFDWFEIDAINNTIVINKKSLPIMFGNLVDDRNGYLKSYHNAPNDIAKSILQVNLRQVEQKLDDSVQYFNKNRQEVISNFEKQKNALTFDKVKENLSKFSDESEAWDYFKNLKGISEQERIKFIEYCEENNIKEQKLGFIKLYRSLRNIIETEQPKITKQNKTRIYELYRCINFNGDCLQKNDKLLTRDNKILTFSHILMKNDCSGIGVFFDDNNQLYRINYKNNIFNKKLVLLWKTKNNSSI